jgi:hypothetical protein
MVVIPFLFATPSHGAIMTKIGPERFVFEMRVVEMRVRLGMIVEQL